MFGTEASLVPRLKAPLYRQLHDLPERASQTTFRQAAATGLPLSGGEGRHPGRSCLSARTSPKPLPTGANAISAGLTFSMDRPSQQSSQFGFEFIHGRHHPMPSRLKAAPSPIRRNLHRKSNTAGSVSESRASVTHSHLRSKTQNKTLGYSEVRFCRVHASFGPLS